MIKKIKIKNVCLCFKSVFALNTQHKIKQDKTTMTLDIGYLFVTSIR